MYEKLNQELLTWFTSMRGNNISIIGTPRLEELVSSGIWGLLAHLRPG